MSDSSIDEARRQTAICNACRYCEGFCAVFPAIQRHRQFNLHDVVHLANLCHNCRACHYSCQYAAPHEFAINIPATLAEIRVDSWERYATPKFMATAFQRHAVPIALMLVVAFTFFMLLIGLLPDSNPEAVGFYRYLPHTLMVLVFTPAFLFPLFTIAMSIRRYWIDTGGTRLHTRHWRSSFAEMVSMRNLAGGQGQGCNFEQTDHFSNARRYLHQLTVFGFLLCFASTSSATVMHYFFDLPAPYAWYTLPKLFGVSGGVALTVGCAGLAMLKLRADTELGAKNVWGAEMAFVLLLGLTGFTGLVLYAVTGTALVGIALAVHLGFVLTLFLLLPYSKMVHGFFRVAALLREAQLRES